MDEKLKIFIVEDERIVAEDINYYLQQMGYVVAGIAGSGRKALSQIEVQKPDLVLMDVVLRGQMSGINTAEQIRTRFDIPIIYLTAHADEQTLNRAKITEPFGYILKPLSQKELKSSIEMAIYKYRTEKRLRERESLFSTTLRSIGDGVIATDPKNRVVLINRMAEELTGWTQEEADGKPLEKVFQKINRDSGKKIKKSVENIIRDRLIMDPERHTILITKDKKTIPIEETSSHLKNDKGEILGGVVIFHDITERLSAEMAGKLGEEALRESEERYRSIFEDSSDAIYITTQKGRFIIANPSTLELFGFNGDEMVRLNIRDLFLNTEDWKQFRKDIEQHGSVRDYEVQLRNKSGDELSCLLTSTTRRTKDHKIFGYHGIIRDITRRKRAEDEKEKIQAQLLQSQKMEAVGILAGGIAHDFNNILTIIQGNSDLSMLRLDESDPIYRDLMEIQNATNRAADLTSQLLLFSRKKPMKFVAEDLNRIIESLLKMLHRLIGEDIGISTDLEPNIWTVRADRGTVEQVIMNLAVNARDAISEGGRLIIKSENIKLTEAGAAKMHEARPGEFVCLTITDTGVGMKREIVDHIFDPFFSTKGTGKGTGLGLSVVYGIVKQHSGWLSVTSKPNVGSTFKIYMPAVSGTSVSTSDTAMPFETYKGDGSRILVVEDEKGVNDFTTVALKENGYVVHSAVSVKEAINIFLQEKKNFNMVLSDVVLSDKTGLDLVDELLVLKPDLRIVLCSGYTGKKAQWATIQERGFPFMPKPYTLIELLRTVKETLTSN